MFFVFYNYEEGAGMKEGHEIIEKVYAAKEDPDAADGLIRQ